MFIFTFMLSLIHPSTVSSSDNQPPQIELQNLSDSQRVYTEKLYIAGEVTDAQAIKTLKVNGTSILKSSDRSISFSHLLNLNEGKNIIAIEAADSAGNSAKKEIVVIRENLYLSQLPKAVLDQRMRVAVYPFEKKGSVSEESGLFMDLLALALQRQNRFQLTDRALLERVLEEQQLSLTQVIDQDAAVKTGRIMSAQAIITGSIIKTRDGMGMVGRMIDTETSEIVATERIHTVDSGISALNFLAESMAVRFHNDFPMLTGVVIKRSDGHIFTDMGRNTIPLRGMLIIYRENDPKTYNTILGYARVTQVLPDMSKAELISGSIDVIRELDKVVLQ